MKDHYLAKEGMIVGTVKMFSLFLIQEEELNYFY